MNGVTILNTYNKYISGPGINGAVIFFIILIILCILSFIICIKDKDNDAPCFLVVAIIFSLIAYGFYCHGNPTYSSYEAYRITIDDTVLFNEFNQKYEIIDQEGSIYTVKERDN